MAITDNKFLQGALVGAAGLVLVKKFFFHHDQKHHHTTMDKDIKSGRTVEHDIGEGHHMCACGHEGVGPWKGSHEQGLADIL